MIWIIILGLIMFFSPTMFYKITHFWLADNNGEPTDNFIKGSKIGGICLTVIGVVLMVLILLGVI